MKKAAAQFLNNTWGKIWLYSLESEFYMNNVLF